MKPNVPLPDADICANFDVSVILPFYKKLKDFTITLQTNHVYFERNGIEVIICMDEPGEKPGVMELVASYPLINWKIIVNDKPHEWRNPGKAINVGIRNASRKYVLVMGPDSEMTTDIILRMRRMAEYYHHSFFIGCVAFVDYDYAPRPSQRLELWDYGSIFVNRESLITVGGYNEEFDKWGGDDDNIRARLQRFGLKKIRVRDAILLHREHRDELETSRKKQKSTLANRDVDVLLNSFYPRHYKANETLAREWGTDFSFILQDWNNKCNGEQGCRRYLEQRSLTFEWRKDAFKDRHRIIALVPVYNEQHQIQDLLHHLDKHCDGVILLDDASTDNTYQLAKCEKLLLKVKKRSHHGFDDLANRNMLLDLGSFFQCEYFFFIDADERFDERYGDLYTVASQAKSNTICFYLVHIWNDLRTYRTNVPEESPVGQPGILHRWRMFRNLGRMQISGERLHFHATPYKAGYYIAPVLIRHYGLSDAAIRKKKYLRYHQEDDKLELSPRKYDYFLSSDVETGLIERIAVHEKWMK